MSWSFEWETGDSAAPPRYTKVELVTNRANARLKRRRALVVWLYEPPPRTPALLPIGFRHLTQTRKRHFVPTQNGKRKGNIGDSEYILSKNEKNLRGIRFR